MASANIKSTQYSILAMLDGLGEASQRELVDEVYLDRSAVADLVQWISRRRTPVATW